MANYYASARSNKFKVTNLEDFQANMPSDIEVYIEDLQENIVCLLCNGDGTSGGWPTSIYCEDTEEYEDWDVESYVSEFLVDGEWCVIQEVGAEKLRYLIGYSLAFNNKGVSHSVNLEDVFEMLPSTVTPCAY